MSKPCTARIKNENSDEHCVLEAGHVDPEYGTDHAGPKHPVGGRLRWNDSADGAVPHQPGQEDLDAEPSDGPWCCNGNAEGCALCTDPNPPYPFLCPGHPRTVTNERIVGEATQAAELDKTRKYLRPVTGYGTEADVVHLSVYAWLPMFDTWATGMSLCGMSMRQGPLPEGTGVTCTPCQKWRPKYERMLAPGYRPEDDDPEVLRKRIARVHALHQQYRFAGDDTTDYCAHCNQISGGWIPWPCPTVQALGETGDAR